MNVEDISAGGQLVMFNTGSRDGVQPNLGNLSLITRKAQHFVEAKHREDCGRLSPDGHWMTYRSYETNQSEIFVRRVNSAGRATSDKWMVSNGRGTNTQPTWAGDGKTVYYLDHKILTAVELSIDGSQVTPSAPKPLFNVNIEDSEHRNRFLVTKDGQRFLVVVREESKSAP
jgi:Tol biopolymer transport system component